MRRLAILSPALPLLLLLAPSLMAGGCIGVSQKRVQAGGGAQAAPVLRCPLGTRVAPDGLIDDFEDGNTQIAQLAGRGGYWWPKSDGANGSTADVQPDDGGAGGSQLAMHAAGETLGGPNAWGAGFGADLVNAGPPYDASKYAGIVFKAKVGPGSTRQVRFKIGDVNTHPRGNVCTTACWNHFGKDLTLGPEWKEYKVMFAGVEQEPGWGSPRPPALATDKLIALDWSIGPAMGKYDIWVDDVAFLDCQQ
jgi:endoglucanase